MKHWDIVFTLTNIWVRRVNITYLIIGEAINLTMLQFGQAPFLWSCLRFLEIFRASTIVSFLVASRFICAKTFIQFNSIMATCICALKHLHSKRIFSKCLYYYFFFTICAGVLIHLQHLSPTLCLQQVFLLLQQPSFLQLLFIVQSCILMSSIFMSSKSSNAA